MKKAVIVLSFICILFVGDAFGEQESRDGVNIDVPPGMEVIKEGDVNVVVFKGGQARRKNDVILPETPEDYSVRKFADADSRFRKIEEGLASQKEELENQKKEIADLKGAVNDSQADGTKK